MDALPQLQVAGLPQHAPHRGHAVGHPEEEDLLEVRRGIRRRHVGVHLREPREEEPARPVDPERALRHRDPSGRAHLHDPIAAHDDGLPLEHALPVHGDDVHVHERDGVGGAGGGGAGGEDGWLGGGRGGRGIRDRHREDGGERGRERQDESRSESPHLPRSLGRSAGSGPERVEATPSPIPRARAPALNGEGSSTSPRGRGDRIRVEHAPATPAPAGRPARHDG